MSMNRSEPVRSYKFYICLSPRKQGILCEVELKPGMVLIDTMQTVVSMLLATHAQWLPRVTPESPKTWIFLHGDLQGDIEILDPERTLHDLAIFAKETIYVGPAHCFSRWVAATSRE